MKNDLPQHDDPLDTLLSEAETHMSDDGFTRRVLFSLPARNTRRPYRFSILLTAGILSGAAAFCLLYWFFSSPNWISDTYADVGPITICSWLAAAIAVFAAIWGLRELTRQDTSI